MAYNDYLTTKELYHHGVKGMKWGVRHDDDNQKKTRAEIKEQKREFNEKVKELAKSDPKQYGGSFGRGLAKIDVASTYKNPDKHIKKYARSGKAAVATWLIMGTSVVALLAAHDIAALAGYARTFFYIL